MRRSTMRNFYSTHYVPLFYSLLCTNPLLLPPPPNMCQYVRTCPCRTNHHHVVACSQHHNHQHNVIRAVNPLVDSLSHSV